MSWLTQENQWCPSKLREPENNVVYSSSSLNAWETEVPRAREDPYWLGRQVFPLACSQICVFYTLSLGNLIYFCGFLGPRTLFPKSSSQKSISVKSAAFWTALLACLKFNMSKLWPSSSQQNPSLCDPFPHQSPCLLPSASSSSGVSSPWFPIPLVTYIILHDCI